MIPQERGVAEELESDWGQFPSSGGSLGRDHVGTVHHLFAGCCRGWILEQREVKTRGTKS